MRTLMLRRTRQRTKTLTNKRTFAFTLGVGLSNEGAGVLISGIARHEKGYIKSLALRIDAIYALEAF